MEEQHKKYSQFISGQFRKTSKKKQALFIGRAIQLLTESVLQYAEEKKLRLETLRYAMNEEQLMSDEGEPVDGWVQITVGYEVGSTDPFTEEDRKELEERRKKREEQMIEEDQEVGDAALRAMGILPHAEDQIQ